MRKLSLSEKRDLYLRGVRARIAELKDELAVLERATLGVPSPGPSRAKLSATARRAISERVKESWKRRREGAGKKR